MAMTEAERAGGILKIQNALQIKGDLDKMTGGWMTAAKVKGAIKALIAAGAQQALFEMKNYDDLKKTNFQYDHNFGGAEDEAIVTPDVWMKWQLYGTRAHDIKPVEKLALSNLFTGFPRQTLFVTRGTVHHPGTRPNRQVIQEIQAAARSGASRVAALGQTMFISKSGTIQLRDDLGRFSSGVGKVSSL